MKIENIKASKLKPATYNPRQISTKQYKDLSKSIATFGLVDPIIVNKDFTVIGGHQRLKVLNEMQTDTIPCVVLDLSKEKERELNVRLNKNSGEFDMDILANEFDIDELVDWGFKHIDLGLNIDKIEEGNIEDDHIPEVKESRVKLGDVWQLGKHRLMCGDSTKESDVKKLMNGDKADMVFTDPPYGISVKNKQGSIENDDSLNVFRDFMPIMNSFLKNKIHLYIFFGSKLCCESLTLLKKNYAQHNLLVMPITNQTQPYPEGYFSSNYEMCFFSNYNGYRCHNSGIIEVTETTKKDNRYTGNGYLKKYYALSENAITEHNCNSVHPTQKNIKGIKFYIQISSDANDIILDLFLGSGSTLIACEKTNRTCYGMELDTKYCDVIIERWEQFTGQKATKL